jgi:hypothetical protein
MILVQFYHMQDLCLNCAPKNLNSACSCTCFFKLNSSTTTLKQAIKIAKKIEKSLDSKTRVLKPITKLSFFQSYRFNKVKEPDKPFPTQTPSSTTEPSTTNKEAIKIAKTVEKSLDSQIRVLNLIAKPSFF